MALPNELANVMTESAEEPNESFQRTADAYLQQIQASLENIKRMRIETDQIRAVSEPLLERILREIEQRIQFRQKEIAELEVEKKILQAKLLAG